VRPDIRGRLNFTGYWFGVCFSAKMSFRPFHLNICRAALAGLLCLGAVEVSRAGDPIEVVPFKGSTTVNTNFDQAPSSDSEDFQSMFPHASRSLGSQPRPGVAPPMPQPQTAAPNQQEKELMDRRRNWVFMTPEDFAKPDSGKDWSTDDSKGDGKPTTAMERYYQHLYDLDRASSTNQLGALKPDRGSWVTNSNSSWSDPRKGDSDFGSSPFNTSSDPGIFQPAKANDFSSVFGSDKDAMLPSPEEVRAQAEQKAHMDSFKELWNMNPPPVAAAPAPAPAAASLTPSLNAAPTAMQPALNALNPPPSSGFASPAQPNPPTVTSMRNAGPPHSNFAPPQNPF
jgi:hypothetical protein